MNARQERDREDLMREATALVERVELTWAQGTARATIGFRSGGACSLYFDAGLVLQFNTRHELRRAFADEQMLKADRGKLVTVRKEREADATRLIAQPLDHEATARFCEQALLVLCSLLAALRGGDASTVEQFPPEADIRLRVANWLEAHTERILIAQRPHVDG